MVSGTPGPWDTHRYDGDGVLVQGHMFVANRHGRLVARVHDPIPNPGSEDSYTDARRIAAVPEMEELLEEVASWNSAPYGFVPLVDEARALLARIRGEDQRPEGVANGSKK